MKIYINKNFIEVNFDFNGILVLRACRELVNCSNGICQYATRIHAAIEKEFNDENFLYFNDRITVALDYNAYKIIENHSIVVFNDLSADIIN
ncbi:hypothetical protein [Picrophilus oshimae]|uniref:Uncharacterized protein n=1 Tax=Picrophilus torridus (strain ATCC 700027 / DSM 9790 / JCM 10055 / NBRC 100828 / KAW 2/3) TaxID=1122961 RepID=Q6KZB2_PICTO|nr:hypothetical protein [Picrophilus oshimae]AAT43940.1 hypothetical protein PTO1355 [Picrophilus oshimae DSM 9789]SMD30986.1 hypothetical protein SAMN02745355_0904 [Picrophilus oshimae DSM 9789]